MRKTLLWQCLFVLIVLAAVAHANATDTSDNSANTNLGNHNNNNKDDNYKNDKRDDNYMNSGGVLALFIVVPIALILIVAACSLCKPYNANGAWGQWYGGGCRDDSASLFGTVRCAGPQQCQQVQIPYPYQGPAAQYPSAYQGPAAYQGPSAYQGPATQGCMQGQDPNDQGQCYPAQQQWGASPQGYAQVPQYQQVFVAQ